MARREGFRWRRDRWQPNDRQREVLDLLAEGKTNAEIAVRLGITLDGAKWHVSELLSQTGLSDRQALASWWQREQSGLPSWVSLPSLRLGWIARGLVFAVTAVSLVLVATALRGDRDGAPVALTTSATRPTPSPSPEAEEFSPVPLAYEAGDAPQSCPVSQMWRLRPEEDRTSVMSIGTGDGRMAWLSWPPVSGWHGPGYLSTIAWTITPEIKGDAILTGHQVDGDAVALFATRDSPEVLSDTVVLPAPHDATHLVYVITPGPGCWQFVLRAENSESRITVYREGEPVPASCPVSSSREVRPSIAPGIGGTGVWMIASQVTLWLGADTPIKTIWLIDEAIGGAVRLTGERIDGPGIATFIAVEDMTDHENAAPGADATVVAGINARNRERLLRDRQPERIIEPPHGLRVDRRGYVFYSSPGCWRFTAETEQGKVEIIKYVSPPRP